MKTANPLPCLALALLLSACGGGSGDSSNDGNGNDSAGEEKGFTLKITDAPIDNMVAVVLQFTKVRLRKADGTWVDFPLDTPQSIDLLQLQGTLTKDLLSNVTLPIGRYDEIRLLLDDAPMANYVDLGAGGLSELKIPSGSSSGLEIKGEFTWSMNETKTLVIDIDLRQSIKVVGKSGKFMMEPVLRLVDADKVGHLRGQVSSLRLSPKLDCSDSNPNTYNAVYVYKGHDVIPVDIDQSSGHDVDPIATTPVRWVSIKAAYEYEAAFLPEGDYTIAITCNANLDDLDRGGDDLKFFIVRNVIVTAL